MVSPVDELNTIEPEVSPGAAGVLDVEVDLLARPGFSRTLLGEAVPHEM